MKYVLTCPNSGCIGGNVVFEAAKYRMKYDKETKKMKPEWVYEKENCPFCGAQLVFAEAPSGISVFSVGTFKGLSDEQKKEVLHKRYKKGMTKGGNDEGELRKRNAIKNLIGYE